MIPREIKVLYYNYCKYKISKPGPLVNHPNNIYSITYDVLLMDDIKGWTFGFYTTTYFYPVNNK